ncbi:hypothetical protein [Bradyrhizobium sp. LM6.9]
MRSMWLVLASTVLLATSPAKSQDGYPSKQVTVIVPFAAGGTADIFARMVSNHLQMKFGQAVRGRECRRRRFDPRRDAAGEVCA